MKAISTQKKFHYWIVFINRKCQENMILTAYIFICIMSGSSNTASPYNYFQGVQFAGEKTAIDSKSSMPQQTSGEGFLGRRQIDATAKLLSPRPKSIDQKYESWNVPFDGCCYNGGTCFTTDSTRDSSTNQWCQCPKTFTGRFCEIDVNECFQSHPCKEHERCVNYYGGYNCTCEPDFVKEGDDCIPRVTCEEFPCLNGAECEDTENGHFKCWCALGFLGQICDIPIPECEDSSCSKDDTCISTEAGYRCLKTSQLIV